MSLSRLQVVLMGLKAPLRAVLNRPLAAAVLHNARDQSRHSSSAADVDHKLYELRTYSVKPDHMAAFVKLANEHMHKRLQHSKLIGYWMTDLGGLNEMVHIWEYDNFAHRTSVRAALAKDDVFQSDFFQHAVKMWSKQDNAVLKAIPGIPIQAEPRKEGGVYELRRYIMKPDAPPVFLEPFLRLLKVRVDIHEKLKYGKLIGAWTTEIGDVNTVYHLWNYESLDKRTEGRHIVLSHDEVKATSISDMPVDSMTTKLMHALPFSPLK